MYPWNTFKMLGRGIGCVALIWIKLAQDLIAGFGVSDCGHWVMLPSIVNIGVLLSILNIEVLLLSIVNIGVLLSSIVNIEVLLL
jgi:hypothetical protein